MKRKFIMKFSALKKPWALIISSSSTFEVRKSVTASSSFVFMFIIIENND